MEIILTTIGIYLLTGLVVLGLWDLVTGKIRKRLKDASAETQMVMMSTAQIPVGRKKAMVITLLALWIYWPAAFIKKGGKNE